jgi:hypothetical protein
MLVPFALAGLILVCHVGVLQLWQSPKVNFDLARDRFFELPIDNRVPFIVALDLEAGGPPGSPADGWQSSDRPPAQTGFLLFTESPGDLLGSRPDPGGLASGILLQGVWVLGLWAFVIQLGFARRFAAASVAFVGFTGLALVNDVYTWPKLAMAGFVLGAWAVGTDPDPNQRQPRLAVAAALWTLAFLCHGGVLFSLVGAVPLALSRLRRPTGREVALIAVPIFVVALPWLAYQRFYQPPGDRMLKWHLAGVHEVDERSVPEALVDQYGDLGVGGLLRNRAESVQHLVSTDGDWIDPRPSTARTRRIEEFFHPGTALGAGMLLAGSAVVLAVVDRRRGSRLLDGATNRAAWWLAWSTVAWVVLLYEPVGIVVHQGSLAIPVGLLGLLVAVVARRAPPLVLVAAGLQVVHFATTWLVRPTGGPADLSWGALEWRAALVVAVCGLALAAVLVAGTLGGVTPSPRPGTTPRLSVPRR